MPSRFLGTSAPTMLPPLFLHFPAATWASWCSSRSGWWVPSEPCSSLWMKLASTRQQSTREIEVVLWWILQYEKLRNLNILENKDSRITKGSFSSDSRPVGKTLKQLKQWIFQTDTISQMCNTVLEIRDRNLCFECHAWQRRQRISGSEVLFVAGLCGNST